MAFNPMSLCMKGGLQTSAGQMANFELFARSVSEAQPFRSGVKLARWEYCTYVEAESAANAAGSFGNQFWPSTDKQFHSGAGSRVIIKNVSLAHDSPRLILVRLKMKHVRVLFIIAHGPHDDPVSADAADTFWELVQTQTENSADRGKRLQ
jgi:hypothetical protein